MDQGSSPECEENGAVEAGVTSGGSVRDGRFEQHRKWRLAGQSASGNEAIWAPGENEVHEPFIDSRPVPDAMKPGFQCVRTCWKRDFICIPRPARPEPAVPAVLAVPPTATGP